MRCYLGSQVAQRVRGCLPPHDQESSLGLTPCVPLTAIEEHFSGVAPFGLFFLWGVVRGGFHLLRSGRITDCANVRPSSVVGAH